MQTALWTLARSPQPPGTTLVVGRYDFGKRPEYRVGELSNCDSLNRAYKIKA